MHKYYGHNLQQQQQQQKQQQEQQQFSHKIFLGRWPEKEQGKEREREERRRHICLCHFWLLVAGCPDNLSPVANCWRGIEMSASTSTRVSLVPTRSLSMPVKFAMMDEPTTCASPVRTSVSACLPLSLSSIASLLPLSRQLIYECDCLALFPLGKTFPFALSPSCNLSLVCPALSL